MNHKIEILPSETILTGSSGAVDICCSVPYGEGFERRLLTAKRFLVMRLEQLHADNIQAFRELMGV